MNTHLPPTGRLLWGVLALACTFAAPPLYAQNSDSELRRAYDDTLAKLSSAQDRKNELAIENEKLRAELDTLKSQLVAERQKAATIQSQLDVLLERSYASRATQAAFSTFLRNNPQARKLWELHFAATFPKLDD